MFDNQILLSSFLWFEKELICQFSNLLQFYYLPLRKLNISFLQIYLNNNCKIFFKTLKLLKEKATVSRKIFIKNLKFFSPSKPRFLNIQITLVNFNFLEVLLKYPYLLKCLIMKIFSKIINLKLKYFAKFDFKLNISFKQLDKF